MKKVQDFILSSRKIEYGLFDKDFILVDHSKSFLSIRSDDHSKKSLMDIFPELLGYEEVLAGIISGNHQPLQLDFISGETFKNSQAYYTFQAQSYPPLLLVTLQDITPYAKDRREVVQRRNELSMIRYELIDNLRKANKELIDAYETTLEGWSKALELRDYETKGHSQHVTDAIIILAKDMGVSEDDLCHYRRGALLHDIGKMGIPDSILLKKGPLTAEEWEIMRCHPRNAHDLLCSIQFLKPAMDIPFYHHEKWNGTGYPCGLKGEQIPLAARIFAVVDVWHALSSNRPYRKAFPKEEVYHYLSINKGLHFDPVVIDHFLALLVSGEIASIDP
jgi:HD-GYP domain-containing protein (c-di-GMP phosphodiesterase class II)